MISFARGFLWTLVFALGLVLLQPYLGVSTVAAQASDATNEGEGEIDHPSELYWKCWRTPSQIGYGFSNPVREAGSIFATPHLPASADAAPGRDDLQWHLTRQSLIDSRFYADPHLRSPDLWEPQHPYSPSLPPLPVNPGDHPHPHALFEDVCSACEEPQFSASVTQAEARIASVTTVWSTHSGAAGTGQLDEVKAAQQEQAADSVVTDHVASRQVPYQGSVAPSAGTLDPHAQFYNYGELGGDAGTGVRLDTGIQDAVISVTSGTVLTQTTGSTTTTQFEVGSTPSNVTNEVSITSRNSLALPEVQQQSVGISMVEPELKMVASTGYHDDSQPAHDVDAWLGLHPPLRLQTPPGYAFIGPYDSITRGTPSNPVAVAPPGQQVFPAPACVLAQAPLPEHQHSGGGSREYRVYCWMVRSSADAPAIPSQTGATQTVNLDFRVGQGGDSRFQEATVTLSADYTHLLQPPTTTVEIPRFEVAPAHSADPRVLAANTPGERAYGLQPDEVDDSPSDAIQVTLELKDEYRRDPKTPYGFTDNAGEQQWKLFGDETVAIRRVPLPDGSIVDVGYRQPYLVPPFWGRIGKPAQERLVPYLYDHNDPLVANYGADSVFRWPVRLDELNYYLFHAPGFTKEHARSLGHVWNLSYSYTTGIPRDAATLKFLGLTANFAPLSFGANAVGEAVEIPDQVEGTSGRTGVAGYGAYHLNPFSRGQSYLPMYDLELYEDWVGSSGPYPWHGESIGGHANHLLGRHHLLKAGVVAPDDRGEGDAYDANSRFQFTIKEGLPAGDLGAGSSEAMLSRLGILPSYVAARSNESSPIADEHGFVPQSDPLGTAWPNARIDPDDTHVLIVTFYEGRLGEKLRLKRDGQLRDTGTGADNVAESAWDLVKRGARSVGDLGQASYDYVSGRGDVEYAAVPQMQYRRVMCRIIVPPEGVVLPPSGFDGMQQWIADSALNIVATVKNAISKLLDWLESAPRKLLEGSVRAAEQGVCQGAGYMGVMGDQSPADSRALDHSIAVDRAGADAALSEVELSDVEGRAQCERVQDGQGGLGTAVCGDVARAVNDPSCSTVPAVDFEEAVQAGGLLAPFDIYWQFDSVSYDPDPAVRNDATYDTDVRLYPDASYAVSQTQIGGSNYSLGLPLESSVSADLGVPRVTLQLPEPEPRGSDRWPDVDNPRSGEDFARVDEVLDLLSQAPYHGFILYVRPDRKSSGYTRYDVDTAQADLGITEDAALAAFDVPLNPRVDELRLVLPLYYVQAKSGMLNSDEVRLHSVRQFSFGNVPFQRDPPVDCRYQSVPILTFSPSPGSTGIFREPLGPAHDCNTTYPVRADVDDEIVFIGLSDWDVLSGFLDYLWYLGDGFEYSFAISAYRGWPGVADDFVEGPRSDWLTIRGGADLACLDRHVFRSGIPGADPSTWPATYPPFEHARAVYDHYACRDLLAPGGALSLSHGVGSDFYRAQIDQWNQDASAGFDLDDYRRTQPSRRGVIGAQVTPDLSALYRSNHLFGSSQCRHLWNGTPPGLTWDSPIVRTLWHISWVIAMLLLFFLLLWDGMALSYEGFLTDGRGGVALKAMLPRFALALLLAASSLFICRVVLTLAADVTCFVSHGTGMTFWGFLGTVITLLLAQVVVIFATIAIVSKVLAVLTAGVVPGILMTAFLIAMFTILIFLLWYGIKVFFGMVMRILLLLILCGLSPVAMAMYASPSTSHWTKKWVSMFLGAAFQQLVVLFVLYAGASLAKNFLGDGIGSGFVFWNIFLSILMTLMVVFLASKVPDIVNPGGRGLFSGFGQALMMAAGAAAIIGTAGAGAIMGGMGSAGAAMGGPMGLGGGGSLSGGPLGGLMSRFGIGGGQQAAQRATSTVGGPSSLQTSLGNQTQSPSPQGGGGPDGGGSPSGGGPLGGGDPGGGAAAAGSPSGLLGPTGAPISSDPAVSAVGQGVSGAAQAASRSPGVLGRMAQGAFYGAVRGQQLSASMHRLFQRGDMGGIPLRGYSMQRPEPDAFRSAIMNRGLDPGASAQARDMSRPYGTRGSRRDDDDIPHPHHDDDDNG